MTSAQQDRELLQQCMTMAYEVCGKYYSVQATHGVNSVLYCHYVQQFERIDEMGLDVYKCKVDKRGESTITLYKDETNKSKIALFEKYIDWVEDDVEEVYDFELAMKNKGKNPDEWEWLSTIHDHNTTITFGKIGANDRIVFDSNDIPLRNEHVKRLRYSSVAYQRKQMKVEFYTNFLAGCWYVSKDTDKQEDDSVDYVITQDDLELAKTYCEDDAPMLQWTIVENEFIHFWY